MKTNYKTTFAVFALLTLGLVIINLFSSKIWIGYSLIGIAGSLMVNNLLKNKSLIVVASIIALFGLTSCEKDNPVKSLSSPNEQISNKELGVSVEPIDDYYVNIINNSELYSSLGISLPLHKSNILTINNINVVTISDPVDTSITYSFGIKDEQVKTILRNVYTAPLDSPFVGSIEVYNANTGELLEIMDSDGTVARPRYDSFDHCMDVNLGRWWVVVAAFVDFPATFAACVTACIIILEMQG